MGTPGGSRGTPIRPRGDIGHSRRVREVNLNPADPPVSKTLHVSVCKNFLKKFRHHPLKFFYLFTAKG